MKRPIVYIVHCIDTEGPMRESIFDTFIRLKEVFGITLDATEENLIKLQNKEIKLKNNIEENVANFIKPSLLKYNKNWEEVSEMLDECLSSSFRNQVLDDYGNGWVYSWHCVDHMGFVENPRKKDIGYHNIFKFYKNKLKTLNCKTDELNWHYHPLSIKRSPLSCGVSYVNSFDILNQILCRRIIDEDYFPSTNRPGFHTERQDIHQFLENWIPFDYANQSYELDSEGQIDLEGGRFGDWRRSPSSWCGYRPSHEDYQAEGNCNRWIFRCLNVGTRFKSLTMEHVKQAFHEAESKGSAILAFADHDYRDIRPDVNYVRSLVLEGKKLFPNVNFSYAGANQAASNHIKLIHPDLNNEDLELNIRIEEGKRLHVEVKRGEIFGSQPFLALKDNSGTYFHDNFDVQLPKKIYSYTFDQHTLPLSEVNQVGVASCGKNGSVSVKKLKIA